MKWFPFSKTPEMKVGVLLDIGSKSVGGAIFTKDSDKKPRLLYVAREKLTFQKSVTGANLSTAMYNALELVLFHLEEYGVEHLRQGKTKYRVASVDVVISSPWNASETKTLNLKFKDPTTITETIIEELLSTEEKSFEARFDGTGQSEFTHEVLERKILEMRLNGYPTAVPYGKMAKELEVRMFASIIPSGTLIKIEKAIHKRFLESQSRFHTFSAVAFTSLRDLFPEIDNFIMVQVGGEVSDIAIIKKGSIAEIASAPSGHNSLVRALGRVCVGHPDCALEGLLKIHREVGIQTADQKKVESAIAETKTAWLQHFNAAISNFSEETFLPKIVFLFEEQPYTSLFEDFLKEAESSQFTATAEPFIINAIGVEETSVFADVNKNVLLDEILVMEAGFTSKLENY